MYANMASSEQQSALARSLMQAIGRAVGRAIDETLSAIAEVTFKSLFVLFFRRS